MPEHQNDSRRAYASAPVNQRTAPREAAKPLPVHALLKARAQKARQRQLLGPSMSELLARGAGAPRSHDKLHPGVIAAAVFAVASASALVLVRSGTGLVLAAALAVLGGASGLWQHRSQRVAKAAQRRVMPAPSNPPLFNAEALRKIDEAFEATAAIVPDAALAALLSLKATAVRLTLALNRAEVDASFTVEDRMYVIECIGRYIPDTLGAYLQVPSAQRAMPGLQLAQSADQIVLSQLALLQSELELREQRLQGSAVEPLLRQQRFLEAKATRR